MTTTLDDPLRAARRAVQAGQFRQAWDSLAAQPDPVRQTSEWKLLAAMARWRLAEFGASRSAALQARDGYRASGDVDGEMRAENVAAAGAFALGDLVEAERGFARALSLADLLSDELMLARCTNNLGNVAFYLGRHPEAASFYRLAAVRFELLGFHHGLAETLINAGIVWRDLGNLRESQESAERALEIAQRGGAWRLAAQALAMRGEALGLLGDLPLGRAQVERALALARNHEDRLAEVEALRILGNLERRAGRWEESERKGREALDLATALAHLWTVAEVKGDLGELFAATGRAAEAARVWNEAAVAYARLGADSRAGEMRKRVAATQSLGRP